MASEPAFSQLVRHAVYLERFKGGLVNKLIALLNRVDADLVAAIIKRDPAAVTGAWSTKRLEVLLAEVREINKAAYAELGRELTRELRGFAGHEAGWQAQALQSMVPSVSVAAPASSQVAAAVLARPFQGRLLKEALAGVEAARAARVRDAIRIGFVEGETVDQIVRRIRGTRAAQYADGLLEIDRRGAEALVRTAVAHTANVARESVWAANDDVVVGWRFIATLDSRTSVTCSALDQKVFPLGSGPRPPRHWNCRSSTVPELAEQFAELFPGGTRASAGGQVSRDTTYSDWLRGQPASVQDEVLGPTRGKLFRANKITVDRFTNRRGGELTLDELRQKDAQLFEAAGV